MFEFEDPYDGTVYMLWAQFGQYGNRTTAIQLLTEYDEPYATLSTNLEKPLEDDQIWIKQHDTHKALADAMVKAGLLERTYKEAASGYNGYNMYKIIGALRVGLDEARANG